jgi:hypothetical protein
MRGARGGGCAGAARPPVRPITHRVPSPPWTLPRYDTLLAALPQDFVGPPDALTLVASVMAAAGRLLFQQLGLPLPPWREPRAVLSRWAGAEAGGAYEDLALPPPAPAEQVGLGSSGREERKETRHAHSNSMHGRAQCPCARLTGHAAPILPPLPRLQARARAGPGPFRRAVAAAAALGARLGGGGGSAARSGARAAAESSTGAAGGAPAPRHPVIFGFPEQNHLRRSSAPACVDSPGGSARGSGSSSCCSSLSYGSGDGGSSSGGSMRGAAYPESRLSSSGRSGSALGATAAAPALACGGGAAAAPSAFAAAAGAAGLPAPDGPWPGAPRPPRCSSDSVLLPAGRTLSQSMPSPGLGWPHAAAAACADGPEGGAASTPHAQGSPMGGGCAVPSREEPAAGGAACPAQLRQPVAAPGTVPAAPAASPAPTQARSLLHVRAASADGTRAASAGAGFKPLDELLPRVCTVRPRG